MDSLIAKLMFECKQHKHEVQSKHACVIFKNNKPITTYTYNHVHEHAEVVALRNLLSIIKRKEGLSPSLTFTYFLRMLHMGRLTHVMSKYSMIVIRVNTEGYLMNSKPCERCLYILKLVQIKHVIYSHENTLIKDRTKYMFNDHKSRYYKNNPDPLLDPLLASFRGSSHCIE